jgi:hypothetical protein
VDVPEVNRQLGSQRAGHELGERESLFVIGLGNPPAPLDQVAVHVPDQGHGTAEAERPELQDVSDELSERIGARSITRFARHSG